jgi:hypothetical protein
MSAVVLQGPENNAPDAIFGPFQSIDEAEKWAETHPRVGGYSIAQNLNDPTEFD